MVDRAIYLQAAPSLTSGNGFRREKGLEGDALPSSDIQVGRRVQNGVLNHLVAKRAYVDRSTILTVRRSETTGACSALEQLAVELVNGSHCIGILFAMAVGAKRIVLGGLVAYGGIDPSLAGLSIGFIWAGLRRFWYPRHEVFREQLARFSPGGYVKSCLVR